MTSPINGVYWITRNRTKYTLTILWTILATNTAIAVYFGGNSLDTIKEFSLKEFFNDQYLMFGFLLPWTVFVVVLLTLYLRITALVFQTVEKRTFGGNVSARDSFALYQVSLSTEYHITLAKTMGLVVAIYFLSNVPTLLRYIIPFSTDNQEVVSLVCLAITYTSSVCTPFIYGWTITEFTVAFTHIFGIKSSHEEEKSEGPGAMSSILPTISALSTPDYHDYMEIPTYVNIDIDKELP